MLADFLERARERLTDEVRVSDPGPAPLRAILDELIDALRRRASGVEAPFSFESGADALEVLRRSVLAEVEASGIETTFEERLILSAWSRAMELGHLRMENRRFSALLDALDDGVALLSPDGRVVYLNRRAAGDAERMSGFGPDEAIGKKTTESAFAPELGQRLEELVKRASRGEVITEDLRVPREVGARWVEVKIAPVSCADGTVGAVALVGRDIHERKLAQLRFQLLAKMSSLVGLDDEELLESIARLSIPELADWGMVDLVEGQQIRRSFIAQRDPAKTVLREALSRFQPRRMRHASWLELSAGRSLLISDEATLREGAADEEHSRLIQSLGVRSLLVVPIHSRGQLSARLLFAVTEESGRQYGSDDVELAEELARRVAQVMENARLQQELRRSEERFHVALAAGRIAVYEQDVELRYRYAKSAEIAVDAVGKRHEDLFDADDAVRLDALKRRALAGERVRDEIDLNFTGSRRHYRQAIEPVRDASGAVVGLIGAATDVTDEKQAHAALAQALKLHEQMIGILGHDLRNPLNAISMAAALLRLRSELPDSAREHALRIDRAARRMGEMIGTLLDFAQARFRGSLPVSRVRANLADIARETVDELRAVWPGHTMGIVVEGDPRGTWDPARIAQAISNLVANALTHGADDTPVDILVDGAGAEVTLTVHNTGPVIPRDLIATLFEPFRRGTSERKSRGIGLGLYIVRQIALAHEGSVDVHSSADDGTRFTLRLPRFPTRDARESQGDRQGAPTSPV